MWMLSHQRIGGIAGAILVLWFMTGCVTSKDLDAVRVSLQEELTATRTQMERGDQANQEKIEAVAQDLQSVQTKLEDLSQAQQSGLATIRQEMKSSLSRLQDQVAELSQVRQELEAVRADIALLKPLGMALDAVQERLDAANAVIASLQTETEKHRTLLEGLEGKVQDIHALQEHISQETQQLRDLVQLIEQGVIHRLQIEVNLARDRIHQLQQVLDQFPHTTKDKDAAKVHLPKQPG